MFKTSILTLALLSLGSSAIAATQTINLSPDAAHTLDLSKQQCSIRQAYFGNPRQSGYLEVSLDQPQPRTQKITFRWKGKPSPDPIFLQLHLGGCSQGYALVGIKKSDSTPSSPVTYLGGIAVAASPLQATPVTYQRSNPPPLNTSRATRPLLVPVTSTAPKPIKATQATSPKVPQQIIPQPVPVQKAVAPRQVQRFRPTTRISPSMILRGLNVARSKGEIGYRSDMHWRVNGMIRAMRRGSKPEAASKKAGVPQSVVQALITYSQQ
ncbi:hypothetical protein ACSYAD_19625 [Acaryochloris marina NIES-2412]|uniref:hypothetical protein n=1 Tax=Acaryochloris marina TaxID=155978 RepID=UPI00405892EF